LMVPHGHCLYLQNDTGTKVVKDNICWANFHMGIHIYGSSNAKLNNFNIEGNVLFGQGALTSEWRTNLLIGGDLPITNTTIKDNFIYHDPTAGGLGNNIILGYAGFSEDLTFRGNYASGGGTVVLVKDFMNLIFTNNKIIGKDRLVSRTQSSQSLPFTSGYDFNNNTYIHHPGGQSNPFYSLLDDTSNNQYYCSCPLDDPAGPDWREKTGWDLNSTISTNSPAANEYFVRPQVGGEAGRGHLIVYNWQQQDVVSVDINGILQAQGKPALLEIGGSYELLNAQNYYGGPVMTINNYQGGPISIPMTGYSNAVAVGYTQPVRSPGIRFKVFIVRKIN